MKNHNKFSVRPSRAFGSHHIFSLTPQFFFDSAFETDFTIARHPLVTPLLCVFPFFCSIGDWRKSEFMNLNGLVYARKA